MRRFLLSAALATLLLAACTPSVTLLTRPPDATSTAQSAKPTATDFPAPSRTPAPTPTPALTFDPEMVRGVETEAWFSGEIPILAQMAADFSAVNPWGVKIAVVSYPNLNQLAQAIAASLETNAPPGVALALPEQISAWRTAARDLTPYAAHSQWGLGPAGILPVFVAASSAEGVTMSVPVIRSARYLFYNVTWAQELGFESAPRTWEAFRTQACAANAFWKSDADPANDGFGGLALETFPNWQTPYGWLRAGNGDVLVDGRWSFASEQNTAVLERLLELREAGCAWLPTSLTNFENLAVRRALFVSGSLSDFSAQRAAFAAASSADEWTVIAFPGETPAVPVYGLDAVIFQADARREWAAWLFVRWLTEPEQQVRLARATGWLPVSRPAFDLLQSDLTANAQKGRAAALLNDAVAAPSFSGWEKANKVLADGFVYLFRVFPNLSARQVLEQMDALMNDLLK